MCEPAYERASLSTSVQACHPDRPGCPGCPGRPTCSTCPGRHTILAVLPVLAVLPALPVLLLTSVRACLRAYEFAYERVGLLPSVRAYLERISLPASV